MKHSILHFFIFFLLLVNSVDAQDKRYIFKRLTNADGPSYNAVRDIAQEKSGIIWFTTLQGLNSYDSYNIKSYYKEDNIGIPTNNVVSVLVTDNNRLFVGTEEGLIEYNRQFENFEPHLYEGLPISDVMFLTETSTGEILLGTYKGLFAYHPKQNKVIQLISLQQARISSIFEYKPNVFLVGTYSGVYIINSDGVILEYFDTNNTPSLPTNQIKTIHVDKRDNCWVTTNNSGLFLFDMKKKLFINVKLAESDVAEAKVLRKIEEDLDGNIWISGELGIFIVEAETHRITNIQRSLENSEYNLSYNPTIGLFRSKENIMWIGTDFGGVNYTLLDKVKGFYNIHPGDGENELKSKAINKIFKDSKGILWIATQDGGVCTFDTNTKKIINFFQHEGTNSLSSNNILSICEDKYGNIWFGHYMADIDIYNPRTGKFKNISINPDMKYSIMVNSVPSIYEDSQKQMWVGTRAGVYRYDFENDKLVPFKSDELGGDYIHNIIEDKKGNMWFSMMSRGVACYIKDTGNIKRYGQNDGLSALKIIASTEDSSGRIWFGTVDGGVNIYYPESDSFKVLTMEDGLPNNTVYGILEDEEKNMWFSSNSGLSRFTPNTESIRNYNLSDGLAQMQFNFNSYFKDDDGTFYFGHINGLSYFKPNEVVENTNKPQLLLTDFKLSNLSVPVSENGMLTAPINETESIALSYSQKEFTIDFVAVNHFSAGNNSFFYFLEGFEKEWNHMGNKTSATYTNLSPGKYTFWLRAENNDGYESENMKSLHIRILPPFYLSIWAFLVYSGLLAGLIFFYRKITIEKEREKAALHLERIEKQNMKELNQQRLNFYTYISHEFKTPLSIIISSIDQFFKEENIAEDLRIRYERLRRSSKRLSFLFNQLMDFRKIETKHAKLILQKGDVVKYLRETSLVFSPLFDQQRVNFEFKSNREEYEYWFDADKIEKIVTNLISNAVKHTPIHGKVTFEVQILDKDVDEEKKKLVLCISDSGGGISEEDQKNLFTPFYVNYDQYEQKSGSGIGLNLVKSIVEYLHGNIEVKSKLNEGTKFKIQLPLDYSGISNIKLENNNENIPRNIDIESIAEVSSKLVQPKKNGDKSKEFKMLIVEDTTDLAEVLVEHYTKNFNVSCASNGVEALKIVKEEEPDIIISDVMMPQMNGIDFCKKIKSDEATSHIAVILLTAKTTHEDKIAGLEAGAEAYVRKPFDLNELDLHVRNFIEVRKKLNDSIISGKALQLEKLNFQDKDKEFIEKVSEIISENLESETLNTEELANQLGMSKTLVYLKLKKLLNMSGSDYIQSLRFKKAIELMADTNRNISGIAYEVGFSDPNYFSKVFKKVYKKTPSGYRKELHPKIK